MTTTKIHFPLSALALATTLLLAACGGGDASPPAAAVDTTPPTVTITDSVAGASASGDVTFTFTFSEDVGTSFIAADVVVTGGTAGTFTRVSGTQATLVVTPTANATGTIDVSVAAVRFTDAAGNANTATAAAQQAYDTVPAVVATTIVSFDEATAPTLIGFAGAEDSSLVADPAGGAANKVMKVVKSATAELFAGTTIAICPNNAVVPLPFVAGKTTLSARVWSPDANVPVRLKVENSSDPTKSVETEATVSVANGWQTLNFNFANQATGTAALNLATTYDKATIFFNFGQTGAQVGAARTYFADDLAFAGSTFAVQCPAVTAPTPGLISFDEVPAPVLTGFAGSEDATIAADPAGGANKVARVVKSATAEVFAGVTVSNLAGLTVDPVAFSAGNTTMTARVWSPDANVPVRLKVENAANGALSVETEATVTAANTWQTLTFNFANNVTGTPALNLATTYNKATIFFNFGKTGAQVGAAKIYFLDEVRYTAGSAQPPAATQSLPVTFDASGVTYTLTGFGGAEDSTLVVDPTGGTNKVAKVVKSTTAELFAGTTISTGPNNSIATVPFTATAKTMTLRVYSPVAGVPIRLKVEDAADPTRSVETEATVGAANTWQTLTFNFANQATGTAALNLGFTFNKASVFPNFGKTGAQGGGGTYYFDDLSFVP